MTQRRAPAVPHRKIADRVKQLRQARGWSAQRLAEEMTQAGIAWDRSIVANFETGRRQYVTAEELVALARVLTVPAVELLVSGDTADDAPYLIAPNMPTTAADARDWITGVRLPTELTSAADLAQFLQGMPKEQAQAVAREYFGREGKIQEWNKAALESDQPEE